MNDAVSAARMRTIFPAAWHMLLLTVAELLEGLYHRTEQHSDEKSLGFARSAA